MPCGGKRCLALLYLLFISKALSFSDGDNTLIIGLLLLLGEIDEEHTNNGFCVFRVLHLSPLPGKDLSFHFFEECGVPFMKLKEALIIALLLHLSIRENNLSSCVMRLIWG